MQIRVPSRTNALAFASSNSPIPQSFNSQIFLAPSRLRDLRASPPGREASLVLRTARRWPGSSFRSRRRLPSSVHRPLSSAASNSSMPQFFNPSIFLHTSRIFASLRGPKSISIPIPISIAMNQRSVICPPSIDFILPLPRPLTGHHFVPTMPNTEAKVLCASVPAKIRIPDREPSQHLDTLLVDGRHLSGSFWFHREILPKEKAFTPHQTRQEVEHGCTVPRRTSRKGD
ncbi:hypothetical protein Dret_0067 [Desulfohalobium retbaense DSM 5692]|uniref:Uncharacterized protein n=1 Tax=Desulfohalobium retbaense (strain ATCC 49708 / DSM 5692 / JCM 16813 / HR100) TaxID=485915 RepID=C8WZ94_DESRD|nr:hypothetical protein Dret_0067 [Desulfohalobium retbaense DSM 5692]